jgi:hypothetical protein
MVKHGSYKVKHGLWFMVQGSENGSKNVLKNGSGIISSGLISFGLQTLGI